METNMSDLNILLAENENFKFVVARFANATNTYTYKTVLDIEPGDFVVVDTPSNGFQVVEAVEVASADEFELTYSGKLKWIVSKVDTAHYDEVRTMEREANKRLNKAKAIKSRREHLAALTEELGEDELNEVKKLVRL